jgi:hypothetical protein
MGFQPEDIADLVATTQNHYERDMDYALEHNEYFWTTMFQKDTVKYDGGTSIERKVSFDRTGNAKYRSMYDLDSPKIADHIHTINVHWALIGTNASWDEFEILQQKNAVKRIIDLVHSRLDDAYIDLADLIEETMVSVPDSATDRKHPFTLPYFLRVLNSAGTINTTAGFNGCTVTYGDASTGTICAGIDSNVEDKWRNYTGPYTAINNAFLKVARRAFIKTHFKYPIILDSPIMMQRAKKMRMIAGTDTVLDLMDLVDTRDDNHVSTAKESLGGMLVVDGDLVRMNRVPVIPLDTLDDASYTPIYAFDLAQLQPFVHDGYWMERKKPMVDRGQHTTFTTYVDGAHNILPRNMQKLGFVLHKTS